MKTSITRQGIIRTMGAPRKYPDELHERATRMALEALADCDRSHGAIVRVAEQLRKGRLHASYKYPQSTRVGVEPL